ncbi:hypothetical protein JG688_00016632 [Phytophthora aleatoria]|uniref:Uncharacterized protein n=1 Tax=Phytophthora aleatoria TaxID=2496075 RepID=A0A8J5MCR1_9STRA|nr:hypothetical protein JG688_00016632 [Phytophthora aleatoria]
MGSSSRREYVTSREIGVVPTSVTSCEWIAVGGGPLSARRAPGDPPSAVLLLVETLLVVAL